MSEIENAVLDQYDDERFGIGRLIFATIRKKYGTEWVNS